MYEKKKSQYVIDEFELVNEELQTVWIEKDVIVKEVNKEGVSYLIKKGPNKNVGLVFEDKKFKYYKEYKKELKEKLGPYYDKLNLDSNTLIADVEAMLEKQLNIENDMERGMQRYMQKQRELEKERQKAQERNKSNDERDREPKTMERTRENSNVKNSMNNDKEKNKNEFTLSSKELEQHPNALIKDREIARQLVKNIDELDFYSLRVVFVDGNPKLMAQRNNSDEFVEIPAYIGARNEMGQLDSMEYGNEREDIEKGKVMTFTDNNGNLVRLDARITNSGNVEVRDVSFGDMDNDGDKEGTKIETRGYTSAKPSASKVRREAKTMDGKTKEDLNIDTIEVNEGALSNEQIKKMLDESNVSEQGRRNIIGSLDNEITKSELEKMINNELEIGDEEKAQYNEKNKNSDEHDKEDYEEERLEPGYSRNAQGILCFRGRPVE